MKTVVENWIRMTEQREFKALVQDMAENHGSQVISGIKTAWGGGNADAFIAKEVKLLNRLYEVAEGFREVANQLEEKAEQIYTLEKGNVLTAQTRTY